MAFGDSTITVKVGGVRTGNGTGDVAGAQGITLQLYRNGSSQPGAPVNDPWGQCVSDSNGACTFIVPETQSGGDNRNDRFWVGMAADSATAYINPSLVTGNGSSFMSTPYMWRTPQLSEDDVTLPNLSYMPNEYDVPGVGDVDTDNRWVTTGIFPASLNNPRYEQTCVPGVRIGILFDLSSSMAGTGIDGAKTGGKAMVDALIGSGALLGIYNFGTDAPKSGMSNYSPVTVTSGNANTLKTRIDNYSASGQPANYTNWDRGLYQLVGEDLDIVIVLTDGNPTVYGPDPSTPGGTAWTRFSHDEQSIFSANALKNVDTQILAFGVGDGLAGAPDNLRAVSGPIAWDGVSSIIESDYAQTSDWALVSTQLANAAKGVTCQVPIKITKTEKLLNGNTQPGNNWSFTIGTDAGTIPPPATKSTNASGVVSWDLALTSPTQEATVTLTEAPKTGWVMASVVCTSNGQPLTVGGTLPTFTLSGLSIGDNVECAVLNQQVEASVKVDKTWVINGTTYAEGSQIPAAVQAQLKLSGTDQAWGAVRTGYSIGATATIAEQLKAGFPALCELESAVLNGPGATNKNIMPGQSFTTPALPAGLTSYTITNTVSCDSQLKLVKVVQNNNGGTATSADWKLTYTGGPVGGVASGTTVTLTPGSYTIGETAGPAGYTQTGLVCTTGLAGNVVTLPVAQLVTCTFTNTDSPATLTLEKLVSGAPGVSNTNWILTASDGGIEVLNGAGGATGQVDANTPFVLSEGPAPGFTGASDFTADAWQCSTNGGQWYGLVAGELPGLPLGSDTICQLTNTAKLVDPTLTKSVTSWQANADGTWTIVYDVVVTNPDKYADLTYDLSDTLAFGGGITPSATAEGPSGPIAGWNGVGNTVLADDAVLGTESMHTYTITAIATLSPGVTPEALVCPTAPTGNGGFLNRATLTANGNTLEDRDCRSPLIPTFDKAAVGTPVDNGDGTWTLTYKLTATHPGTAASPQVYYDLIDTPSYPAGVSIVSATVDGNPIVNGVIADDATLAGGATKEYTVVMVVSVASSVPAADLECTPGKGMRNEGVLTSSGQEIKDSACQEIDVPQISHNKTVQSSTANADGTWTVVYRVRVVNNGATTGVYSLNDEAKMNVVGVLSILSASATGPSPEAPNWTVANQILATNMAIGTGVTHDYFVTVNVQVADGEMSDPAATCQPTGGTNGFLNTAKLTVGGTPADSSACANPVLPTFDKSILGVPVDNGDGTWNIQYRLTVANPHSQSLYYTLSDLPAFPVGVTIDSTTIDPALPAVPLLLAANDTDTYDVTFVVTIPASVPASDLVCGNGKGLINNGTMVSGNQTVNDSACHTIDPPTIVHDKTVTSAAQNADVTWTVVYDIEVENTGLVTGYYSLSDTLAVDVAGVLSVNSASASGPGGAIAGWNGDTVTALATDRVLASGVTEHYTITVNASVAADGLDDDASRCAADGGTNGFLNNSALTVGGVTTNDSACATPTKPLFTKDFVSAVSTGAGKWDVTYLLTVDNSAAGQKANYYTLTDTLGFPVDVTVDGTPVVTETSANPEVDVPWNGGALITVPRLIAAGATDTFEVVVKATVPAGAGDLECTQGPGHGFYNQALLTVGNDGIPAEDCGDITESVVPTIAKSVVAGYPQQQADGNWIIQYNVTVSSTAPRDAVYTLNDSLDFGQGIGILSQQIVVPPVGVTLNPNWNGTSDTLVASGVTLPAAPVNGTSQHVYTIEVKAAVPESVYEDDDHICQPGAPNADKGGFLNTATLTSGLADARKAQACDRPYQPEFEKALDPNNPVEFANGEWTVTYLLTVDNPSSVQLSYDLYDTLGFPQNVVISSESVVTTAPGVIVNPLWNGVAPTNDVVKGQLIPANTEHVFTVTVTAAPGPGFDVDDAECARTPGQGLFNGALLTSGGIDYEDDACADLPVAELTLVKVVDNSQFNGLDLDGHTLADLEDWELTAASGVTGTTITGISGTSEVTSVLVPAGDYAIAEDVVANPGSDLMHYYTPGDWDCLPANALVLTLATGDAVTCTITNTGHPVDLAIDKDDSGAVIDAGDSYTYTFTVDNNGATAATSVVVTDDIPATLRVDMGTVTLPLGWVVTLTGEDVNGFGGQLKFTKLGPFASGDQAVFTFQVTTAVDLPRTPPGTGKIDDIENTSVTVSDGVELDPTDNTSTEVTPVKSLAIDNTDSCVLNAPYADWTITPHNVGDPGATVSLIWWTPAAYAARNPAIPAGDIAALLADGAIAVNILPAPGGGGWVDGVTQSGQVLWAGASVDPVTHEGTGWPGYTLINGQWVLDPTNPYYAIRDSAIVEVRMNPSTASTVFYPPAIVGCKPPVPSLPITGVTWLDNGLLLTGTMLLLGAAVVLGAAHRKGGRHQA